MEVHVTIRLKPAESFVLDLLSSAFPNVLDHPRRVGSEEEYIVVNKDNGTMANTLTILPNMMAGGWAPKFDAVTKELVGVRKGETEVGTDVGVGTLEVGFPPVINLLDHLPTREEILREVDSYLAQQGMWRLDDYAVQPVTVPNFEHWSPKGRGHFFRTFFPRDVDVQTASAASQVHVEVTLEEVVPVLEMLLALSSVLIALNANAPVWGGKLDPNEMMAARQHFWDRFTPQKGCWSNVHVGLPKFEPPYCEQPPSSLRQLAEWICGTRFLVHIEKGQLVTPNATFGGWCAQQEDKLTESQLREAYESHEGTLWWDARPRVPFGTIEVRPSCQNIHSVSSDALVLGLVENWRNALDHVRHSCTHEDWRRLRFQCLTEGLRARGITEAARNTLTLAKEGLIRRGFGEEKLLLPLYRRVDDLTSPGLEKLHIFNEGGIPALLRHLLI